MFFQTKKLMFQPSLMLFTDPTPTTPTPNGGNSGIKDVTVPARRCPACYEDGKTVWVIPGKCCSQCGTPVNRVIVEETRTSTFISTRIEENRPIWLTTTAVVGFLGIIMIGCINIIGDKDLYVFINDIVINGPSYIYGCINIIDNNYLDVLNGETLNIPGSKYICSIYDYTPYYSINTYINDAPRAWGLYFQDSASPQMEAIVELHNNIMYFLAVILFGVGWILISVVKNYTKQKSPISNKYQNHGTLIELIWTITPALILILIAFPSFKLLFLIDDVTDPHISLGVESHQWYWSYQYADFTKNEDGSLIEFDSYLVPESDLEKGALRLLEVDNRVILPDILHTRFSIQSADVIHSFAVPSLGLKCDAYPGRLNQVSALINRFGTFYGQCSEICGMLHSSMPIVLQSVSLEKFLTYIKDQ